MTDTNEKLLSIGAVARATNLTVKAIRHYHEIGLLVPRRVDAWTGYRGYGPRELRRAAMIAVLRELRVPLAEMPAVLDDPGSEAATAVLRAHRARLRAEAATVGQLIVRVDSFIDGRTTMQHPSGLGTPHIIDGTPHRAAVIGAVTTLEDLAAHIPDLATRVWGAARAGGIQATGPLFARYLENPQSGDPFRIQVGIPIGDGQPPTAPLEHSELPGGRLLVAEHHGGYDTLPESWAGVFRWAIDNGHDITGTPWESYLRTPMDDPNPEEWRTLLVCPLAA